MGSWGCSLKDREMGERGGGRRCGGGRQQKYVCAANLMRTFERLNPKESAAASTRCTSNSLSGDRPGFSSRAAPLEREEK